MIQLWSMPERTGKEQEAGERERGRFRPGESGNPAGRPKGARNRASRLAAELLDGDAEAIVRRVIELAKDGNAIALKRCIERLVPRAGRTVEVDLPVMEKAADIASGAQAVIEAAARGDLTIEEAERFMTLLEIQRRALETEDLAVRVEALEVAGKRKKYGLGPEPEPGKGGRR